MLYPPLENKESHIIILGAFIQPLLGIWITSIIFVGLHGYFKFKSAGHIIFGVLMFGLSMGLGYLFEEAGLIAAMVAHAVYDLTMLKWMDGWKRHWVRPALTLKRQEPLKMTSAFFSCEKLSGTNILLPASVSFAVFLLKIKKVISSFCKLPRSQSWDAPRS